MKNISKKFLIIGSVLVAGGVLSIASAYTRYHSSLISPEVMGLAIQEDATNSASVNNLNLTVDQLSEFNGTDPEKPIYIAMDGLIYDVSVGKKYYQPDGAYHYIAGKDATTELHIAGGDIIKRKYPVIGKLIE